MNTYSAASEHADWLWFLLKFFDAQQFRLSDRNYNLTGIMYGHGTSDFIKSKSALTLPDSSVYFLYSAENLSTIDLIETLFANLQVLQLKFTFQLSNLSVNYHSN